MSDRDNFKACYDIKKRGVGHLNPKRAVKHEPFRQAMRALVVRLRATHLAPPQQVEK